MKKNLLLILILIAFLTSSALAAPLFPDVPENHWARDAVADLAAKGILEGYPDGTFKGDRAATRWELAMAMQRFLAKMEAEHAKFASKADLEALRALVNNLKDELDALGVRVNNLEENVGSLDKRITELERITFEGDFKTRFVTIGIKNTGTTSTNWNTDVGGIGTFDPTRYRVGTMDGLSGRPLVNGSGFTARARLGVKIKVSKDLDAGIRFASYTSLGNRYIDAYWGVSAPYLSNVFAGNSYISAQPINNSGWTRMTLDNFWIEHKPSKTELVVGSINKTKMDDFVLHPVPNPGIDGRDTTHYADMEVGKAENRRVVTRKYWESDDSYLPFYGLKVNGQCKAWKGMDWELMYSKLPDDPTIYAPLNTPETVPYVFSATTGFKLKENGMIRINFLRAAENFNNGQNSAVVANRGNVFHWTDPYSYRNDNANKMPMRSNTGISMQGQTSWGISINYRFDPSNIRVVAAYAGSNYKPNQESGYSVDGSHFRVGVGWTNKQNNLDLDLEYLATDPYYDAFQLYYQRVGNMVLGGLAGLVKPQAAYAYIPSAYQLHDSDIYPNNRDAVRFAGEYRFDDNRGRINLRLGFFTQNTASTPHRDINDVYNGFKPGFIDPIFGELASNGLAGANARVYESPKGKASHYGGGVDYRFKPGNFKAHVQYDHTQARRDSSYANNTLIAMTNEVDMKFDAFKLGLTYDLNKRFSIKGGYNYGLIKGYAGFLNDFQANAGENVIDAEQTIPYLGFDYKVNKDTLWSLEVRSYNQNDKLSSTRRPQSPQSFSGYQLMTDVTVKF